MQGAFLKHKLVAVRVHDNVKRDYLYLTHPFVAEKYGSNLTIECLARTLNKEATYRREQHLRWPTTLFVQMDNTSKENKNSILFEFWTLLVESGVFNEIFVSFFLVGHTHADIDQLFSVLTKKLRSCDAYTFDQWSSHVRAAYLNTQQNVRDVVYLWAVHDFKSWLMSVINREEGIA